MQLTPAQVEEYEREGYLFFPRLFTPAEIGVLNAEVPKLYAQERPENVREKGSTAVRTNFAAHTYNNAYGRLARHPRLIEPARQILDDDVYIHQFKINGKAAFDGDVWQWHQDYGTWFNEFNGPLMFIPRSHKQGRQAAGHDVSTTSYPLWTIDNATITRLVADGGIIAPQGAAGSMMLFHCNLVHASGSNMTPWNRTIVYLSINSCHNHIRRFHRPEYIAHRDFTPIECLPDDCLRQ